MSVTAVLGLQWGDEGKGKIVDVLAENTDVVVRCQGGANAGHTVVIGENVFALHLLPSGIIREDVQCVIGNGIVADPAQLCSEIDTFDERGMQVLDRLFISDRAHMLLPFHKVIDGLREQGLGKGSIGTTKRGIGPCYADKANRVGLRYHHARDPEQFETVLRERVDDANAMIKYLGGEPVDPQAVVDEVVPAVNRLRPRIADTIHLLHEALNQKKHILLEGAQGAMLDLDFGTYPYLTSSNTTVGGCCTGTGLPPTCLDEVHGILKSFTTRVGAGPFVTELDGDLAGMLRGTGENQWDEFGTTTGRPRRVGWLDLVVGRYSAAINGVTHLHVQKLDILSQFDELKICTGYEIDGMRLDSYPASLEELERVTPVYETMPGWRCELSNCHSLADLPANARAYVECIADHIGARICTVSYGPARAQTIHCA